MKTVDESRFMRRVAGYHDLRLDGMLDLVLRARGRSVMDVGCNRGLVGFEMANNGAKLVHGCDNYESGIGVARELFADLRNVDSQFECVDLTKGPDALKAFGRTQYDITLMLATYHKLKRIMSADALGGLVRHLGERTTLYFGWRGTSEKREENDTEMVSLDRVLRDVGLRRIQTSYISQSLGVAAIWGKD